MVRNHRIDLDLRSSELTRFTVESAQFQLDQSEPQERGPLLTMYTAIEMAYNLHNLKPKAV
ncbi:MAG: hypothetical protein HC883_01900 [Bdellovibrionaceae bacterium]|nr:hypothetical protein [Pseudobdellovibrionaceae bacterium]